MGKIDSGHYVSYVKHAGQWYRFDDAYITRVPEATVRESEGYLLVYARRTT